MAVICRDAAAYLPAIRYEFRLQGIPLFCDEPTTPENTAPARAVLAALDLVRGGLGSPALLRLVKTGLVDLPEETACALENYAYTWPLHADDWRAPFTRNPGGYTDRWSDQDKADLALAEQARLFLVERAQKFLAKTRGADVTALTRRIYLFLQDLGAERALEQLAADLRERGELPAADEALREWNVVTGLLNDMVQLTGTAAGVPNTLTPAEYADFFTLLLRTTDMGHIPQSLNSVIFTTAGRMRLPETDACFVLGLAEGEFPQTPGDSGLLTHADRDAMIAQGAELPDCFENRVIREQVCFYKALTAPRALAVAVLAGRRCRAAGHGGAGPGAGTAGRAGKPPRPRRPRGNSGPRRSTCWAGCGSTTRPARTAVEQALDALEGTPGRRAGPCRRAPGRPPRPGRRAGPRRARKAARPAPAHQPHPL